MFFFFFFFNDTATTEIYTLSLHDALPISPRHQHSGVCASRRPSPRENAVGLSGDRKSTRLNSSHGYISYAVFCLKKKKKHTKPDFELFEGSDEVMHIAREDMNDCRRVRSR